MSNGKGITRREVATLEGYGFNTIKIRREKKREKDLLSKRRKGRE